MKITFCYWTNETRGIWCST